MALLLLLVVGLAPAAVAGPPLVMEKFEDVFGPERDPFLSDVCGFDVFVEVHVKGKFTLFDDLSAKEHVNVHVVFTNPETGAAFLERDAFTVFSDPVSETVEDDILTVRFSDTFKGLPLKWMQPGNGVLIRDAGQVTFEVTIVIDLMTGEEISFDEQISIVKGPHPFLDLSFEETDAIGCGALDNNG